MTRILRKNYPQRVMDVPWFTPIVSISIRVPATTSRCGSMLRTDDKMQNDTAVRRIPPCMTARGEGRSLIVRMQNANLRRSPSGTIRKAILSGGVVIVSNPCPPFTLWSQKQPLPCSSGADTERAKRGQKTYGLLSGVHHSSPENRHLRIDDLRPGSGCVRRRHRGRVGSPSEARPLSCSVSVLTRRRGSCAYETRVKASIQVVHVSWTSDEGILPNLSRR